MTILFMLIPSILILLLLVAVANKKRIRAMFCRADRHFYEKSKYRCLECGKGRGHLTLIDGHKQDFRKVKF